MPSKTKAPKTLKAELRKRGKHNKRNYHTRFVALDGKTLKVYQKEKHHAAGRAPKQAVELGANKKVNVIKQTPSKMQEAFCSCLSQFAERFFVKVSDSATQKTDLMLETSDRKAAHALKQSLRL